MASKQQKRKTLIVDYLNKILNYEKYGKERVNKRVNKRRSLA